MMPAIHYGKQSLSTQDIDAVINVLQSNFWTQGPQIKAFEAAFANYIGCKYAVAVTSGTAALHLCTLLMKVDSNTNVITTPITFAASANCVRYFGGNVYFADINPTTFLIDIEKIRTLLQSKPVGFFKGIIPVDFAGNAVNVEQLKQLANEYNLWIIEDACHAPGGYFIDSAGKNQKCGNGNFAELAIFSFHPVKHIACGEGGMITTNNKDYYNKLLELRSHGFSKDPTKMYENHGGWHAEMHELSYNYRMPDILCALGISQLTHAAEGLKKRHQIAQYYQQKLCTLPITLPQIDAGHALHLYIIKTKKRKELYDFLKTQNIFCQVHYIPVYWHPYYKNLGYKKGLAPLAEEYYSECLTLPIYPTLTQQQQDYIILKIHEFFK